MNLIRQQEKLRELYKLGILESSHFHAALHAPVFEWEPAEEGRKLSPEEIEFVQTKIQTGTSNVPTVAPFDCFRISMRLNFDLWFRYPEHKQWMLARVAYAAKDTGPEQWFVNTYSWEAGGRCSYRVWRDGVCVTEKLKDANGKVRPEVSEAMRTCLHTLSYFLFETMLPGNTVVRVSPPPRPGKSVEWHLARTHYLVLNHRQAQACQQHKKAPTDKQIARAAHWRRAHFRRLLSDKFKRKGALVPVRQAWVGPLEWQGLDGKIYKVL